MFASFGRAACLVNTREVSDQQTIFAHLQPDAAGQVPPRLFVITDPKFDWPIGWLSILAGQLRTPENEVSVRIDEDGEKYAEETAEKLWSAADLGWKSTLILGVERIGDYTIRPILRKMLPIAMKKLPWQTALLQYRSHIFESSDSGALVVHSLCARMKAYIMHANGL